GTTDGQAYLEVQDEGPGPSPRAREGLGLRVVRQVAEALGANLHLAQEGGFRIRLLFRPPSASSPSMDLGA
ncbi:hypothetical protein CSW16_05670, partial [Thermus scotoductus]